MNADIKKLLYISIIPFLAGCETGPKNIQAICEVQDGDKVIQVVKYEVDTYHWNPHVAGYFNFLGAIYKQDKNTKQMTWLLSKISSDKKYFTNNICSQSRIIDDVVILSPVKLSIYIDKNIHWAASNEIGDDLNIFLFKSKTSEKFTVLKTPGDGPPYIMDNDGTKQSRSSWVNRSFDYKNGILTATQVDFLKATFDSYYAKGDYTTPFFYLEGRGVGCINCEAVISREMISTDNGKSWKAGAYKILDKNRLLASSIIKE